MDNKITVKPLEVCTWFSTESHNIATRTFTKGVSRFHMEFVTGE